MQIVTVVLQFIDYDRADTNLGIKCGSWQMCFTLYFEMRFRAIRVPDRELRGSTMTSVRLTATCCRRTSP